VSQVLKGKPTIDGRPGESMDDLDFNKLEKELKEEHGIESRLFLFNIFMGAWRVATRVINIPC
jgi:pyruvate carboxylase